MTHRPPRSPRVGAEPVPVTIRGTRAAAAAFVIAASMVAGEVAAEPSVAVVDCPFTAEAIDRALVLELRSLGRGDAVAPGAAISCTRGGLAHLVLAVEPPITREIDLGDVPTALAPRVVAVMLAAAMVETRPNATTSAATTSRDATTGAAPGGADPPTASTSPSPAPAPGAPVTAPPGPSAPSTIAPGAPEVGFAPARGEQVGVARSRRRPALIGDRRPRLGVGVRTLTRMYRANPGPLWGVGGHAAVGPVSVGLVHLRAGFDHPLGRLAATITAVDAAVTIACARAETSTCLGARLEVGRGGVTAAATDPMVTGGEVSAIEVHGAVEVTIARELRGVELAGVIALGAGAGVAARAGGEDAARLAGWTLGAAIEVRR